MSVHPAKTKISLGIRPVWSESSLRAQWIAKESMFLHADSEDSNPTGRNAQADLSLHWAHSHFVGFVMSRLRYEGHSFGNSNSLIMSSTNSLSWKELKKEKERKKKQNKNLCPVVLHIISCHSNYLTFLAIPFLMYLLNTDDYWS